MSRGLFAPALLALVAVVLVVVSSHGARCEAGPGTSGSRHLSDATNDTWEAFPLSPIRQGFDWVVDPTNGDVYLFGGITGSFTDPESYLDDLVVYNLTRDAWAPAPSGNTGPGKRASTLMAIDGTSRVIYLFGGYLTASTWLPDLWTYEIPTGTWTRVSEDLGVYFDMMGVADGHLYGLRMGSFGASTLYDLDLTTHGIRTTQPSNWINPTRRWFGWDFDPARSWFFIFGGCEYYAGAYRFYNDTWILNVSAGSFEKRASLPMPGRENTLVAWSPQLDGIYLYGGTESNVNANHHAHDDLWTYGYADDSWTLVQDGAPPGVEYGGATIYDPVNHLLHICCISTCGPYELWTYDTARKVWDDNLDSVGPPGLIGASIGATGGRVVAFGGKCPMDFHLNGLTWEFDVAARRWTALRPTPSPSARCYQSTASDPFGGRMFVVAGEYTSDWSTFPEVWCYNLSLHEWQQFQWSWPRGPHQRRMAVAYSELDDALYAFGGINLTDGLVSSELWRYDLDLQVWTFLGDTGPPARAEATLNYMRAQKRLVMFGGGDGTATRNDMWLYDIVSGDWSEVPAPGAIPPARRLHAAEYDPLVEHLFVSGGDSTHGYPPHPLDDLWYYCFQDGVWMEVSAAGSPSARYGHSLRLDLWNCQLYLFGSNQSDRGIWRLPLMDRTVAIFPKLTKLYATEDSEFLKGFWAMGRTPLTWSLATSAGWLGWNSTGRFLSGVPTNLDVGRSWVNLTATDPFGGVGFLNLTLVVNNTLPAISTRDATDALEDAPYSVDYDCTDDGQGNVTWYLNSAAESWLRIDPATGVLCGTPDDKDVGTFTVIVSVHDGNGGWARTTFHLNVINVNEPPVITTVPPARVTEDVRYLVMLAASDPDPPGDALTWSLATDAAFLTLHPGSGALSGTPSNDDVGTYYVEVTVSDGKGGTDRLRFDLTVENVNDPPYVATRPGTTTIDEDGTYSGLDLNAWFVDPDRDALRFWSDDLGNVTVTVGPGGMATIAPGPDWCGDATITFHASDGTFEVDDRLLMTVRPVNDSPRGATIALVGTPFIEGGAQRALGDATDPDIPFGDELRFLWFANATRRVAVGRDVNLSLPAGTYRLTLNVTDLDGAFRTTSVDLVVLPKPSPPPPTNNGTGGGGGGGDGGGKKRTQGPFPTALGLLAVLMAVAIAVVALILRRSRRGAGAPEEGEGADASPRPIPPEGPGPVAGLGTSPAAPVVPAVCPRCGQAMPPGTGSEEWCPSCGASLRG